MASYNTGLSTIYDIKKWKDELQLFIASRQKCGGPFQAW